MSAPMYQPYGMQQPGMQPMYQQPYGMQQPSMMPQMYMNAQGANSEGLNAAFNSQAAIGQAQANAMNAMNQNLRLPYSEREDANVGDNDDSDCDEDHNTKLELKKYANVPPINTEPNPFRYIFGASEENWHRFYNFNIKADEIYKAYVICNNASGWESKSEEDKTKQKNDLENLRRVVKQGSIISSKTWLTRFVFASIIILIVMIILFICELCQSYITVTTFAFYVPITFVLSLFLLYDLKYNAKGRGINNWSSIKSDISSWKIENNTIGALHAKIDEKFKFLHPFNNPMIVSNRPAQPQQSGLLTNLVKSLI